jgi:hypothetical protein
VGRIIAFENEAVRHAPTLPWKGRVDEHSEPLLAVFVGVA